MEQAESSEDSDTYMQPKPKATLENEMEICLSPSSNGKERIEVSIARLLKFHREKKLIGTKNTKAFKRFSLAIGSKTTTLLRAVESLPKKEKEPNHLNNTQHDQFRVGNVVQEQGNSVIRQDDSPNKSSTNRHDGLV